MSSTLLRYKRNTLKTLASFDGTDRLQTAISFGSPVGLRLQVQRFTISVNLANVYNYNGTNNGLLAVSNTGGATWMTIQLPNGAYTKIAMIEAAINTAAAAWFINASDPAFHLRYNLATLQTYIMIDSSKMVSGQFGIDFSRSQISELLGFTEPGNQIFITDGVYGANEPALINWYGDSLIVWLSGFGPLGILNGVANSVLCIVSLSSAFTNASATEYTFPLGLPSPIIETTAKVPNIQSYSIQITGSRQDTLGNYIPIYCLDGQTILEVRVEW